MSFYETLSQERKHSSSLQKSIQSTVKKILISQTNSENPGKAKASYATQLASASNMNYKMIKSTEAMNGIRIS